MVAAAVSLIGMIAGSTLANIAQRYPEHLDTLETSAGFLLLGAFGLLGSELRIILLL